MLADEATFKQLDLDIIRLQGQAYQILGNSSITAEDVEVFVSTLSDILAVSLIAVAKGAELTEDQTIALLILTIIKTIEVSTDG